MGKIRYEKVLNAAQLEAVTSIEGPILVIAGAGSGKTRTLVYRVARLVETGVPPESILLLTFTRKAAQEMLDRAAGLSDARCRFVSGGTFHSLAHKVLRSHAHVLGFSNAFSILDRSDMEELIHSLIAELGMPKGTVRVPRRRTLANILSKAANLEQSVEDLMIEEYGQFIHFSGQITTLAGFYQEYKKSHHMMDYDDLLLQFRSLLAEWEDVRKQLSRNYRYIMVDEYQDTNTIQADIAHLLAKEHRNIMVVGDDSQAIYSFRGADYKNMFDFPTQFPEAKIVKLEENYRSTQPILTLTNAIMDRARERYTKCLFTRRVGGVQPRIVDTRTEPEQAMFVCHLIKEQLGRGRSIGEIAVLFRAAYHSFELEAELARQGIAYVKYGGFKFLETAHIKDFLAHLRVMVNREDTVSWVRILGLLKNIGHGKTKAILDWMKREGRAPGKVDAWPGAGKKEEGLKSLSRLLRHLSSADVIPKEAAEQVMEYYVPILKEKFDDYPRRQRELEQLIAMASRYQKVRGFLDDLVLEPPNSSRDLNVRGKSDFLTLSTVHSAKGLEWAVVLILWVMEGRFPPSRSYGNEVVLEEERRLLYVAATRAKDRLIMCYPGSEWTPNWSAYPGTSGRYPNGVSSFIRDLSEDVVSYESISKPTRYDDDGWVTPWGKSGIEESIRSSALSSGDKVRHPAFGPGVVSKLLDEDKVEVLFRNEGRKVLHLEYTTLEKI